MPLGCSGGTQAISTLGGFTDTWATSSGQRPSGGACLVLTPLQELQAWPAEFQVWTLPTGQVAVRVTAQDAVSQEVSPQEACSRPPQWPGTHLRDGLLRLFFRPRLRARLPLLLRVSSQSPKLLLPPLLSGPPHSGPASDTHWFRGAEPRPPSCCRWQEVKGDPYRRAHAQGC